MGMNPRLADEIIKNMDLSDDKNIILQRVVNQMLAQEVINKNIAKNHVIADKVQ